MATQEKPQDDEVIKDEDVVETPDDESEEDEDTDTDADDADEEGDEDSDDDADDDSEDDDSDDDDSDDDDEEEAPEFKKAFSQIKGETPEEYLPNLEEAYRKSSREGKKLAGDVKDKQDMLDAINQAAEKDPELAEKLKNINGGEVTVDPALLKARSDYEEEIQNDLKTFMDDHPDLDDDEDLVEDFMANVKILGEAARKKGKVLKPIVAYKRAWAMLDRDDSSDKVVTAAKKTATKPKTSTKKKSKTPKSGGQAILTKEQIAKGKKMGLTEEQMLAANTPAND